MRKDAENLINFIDESPTAFHVVENSEELLQKNGFKKLNLSSKWNLEKEGKYYVTKNGSSLIAFTIGNDDISKSGFKLIGTHTDSPTFRIKPNPEMVENGDYLKLNTEVYGGPILNTWLDRPLSMAGRVSLGSNNLLKPEQRLINFNSPLLTIPNLAIHLNRKVNEGVELNKQNDVLPIIKMVEEEFEKKNYLLKLLSEELEVKADDIIDFDLFLYETEPAKIIGLEEEFISVGKLDDLAMAEAGLRALINTDPVNATNVLVLFDNEEVGSKTKQGADSPMLSHVLERITLAFEKEREGFFQAISNSFIISADMAHALHPNHVDQHDLTNRPVINKGPVIKINANQSYTSNSITGGVYESICKNTDVPVQKFVNRSDKRGGSTIGPISSTQLSIDSVDIGNPVLGMHSIRELGGVKDHHYVIKSFKEFYKI
jgi:aspartyl aminopeptidase